MARIPRLRSVHAGGRALRGALAGLLVAAALLALRGTDAVERVELELVDVRTRTFVGSRPPDERIVIAQIQEPDVAHALAKLGQRWPWPLDFNAGFVRVLEAAGARALMVDVLHLDRGAGPEDLPPQRAPTDVESQVRRNEADAAAAYGDALRAFGRAAVAFELSRAPSYDLPQRRAAADGPLDRIPATDDAPLPTWPGADLPVVGVLRGAARLGFSNTPVDADGTVRRAAAFARLGPRLVGSLSLATAALAVERPMARGRDVAVVGETNQPLMDDGTFLVNFPTAAVVAPYPRVAPGEMLDWAFTLETTGELPPEARERLAGRIVVLGVNLAGVKDVVPSPLGGTMDGPVYQAFALDNLLHGDGRVRAGLGANALLLCLAAALTGLLVAATGGRRLPHLLPLVVAATVVGIAFSTFRAGTSLDLFTPLLGVIGAWLAAAVLRLLTEGRRNRWLEATFGRYMAPAVIDALKRDPTLLELGGREREVTILFSDVAGFTTHAARLAPTQTVALLNRYLTDHTRAVMDAGGVVDKFEGDAVMAFFGDPVDQPDHALRACRAALAVVAGLPDLEPVWREMGLPGFGIRIGLNTGRAVVGNMGSDQRFDYTCLGDTVNVASRIEGAAKAFGVTILVGGPTAEAVRDAMLLKPLGAARVVGRAEPVEVHELVAEVARAPDATRDHVEAFARAVAATRADDLTAARAALAEADAGRPGDGAVDWLDALLRDLGSGRCPRPWDGITVLDRK